MLVWMALGRPSTTAITIGPLEGEALNAPIASQPWHWEHRWSLVCSNLEGNVLPMSDAKPSLRLNSSACVASLTICLCDLTSVVSIETGQAQPSVLLIAILFYRITEIST